MSTLPLATCFITLEQLNDLADAVSDLDGFKSYAISTEKDRIKALVERCHAHIAQAAGEHAALLYPDPPEAA